MRCRPSEWAPAPAWALEHTALPAGGSFSAQPTPAGLPRCPPARRLSDSEQRAARLQQQLLDEQGRREVQEGEARRHAAEAQGAALVAAEARQQAEALARQLDAATAARDSLQQQLAASASALAAEQAAAAAAQGQLEEARLALREARAAQSSGEAAHAAQIALLTERVQAAEAAAAQAVVASSTADGEGGDRLAAATLANQAAMQEAATARAKASGCGCRQSQRGMCECCICFWGALSRMMQQGIALFSTLVMPSTLPPSPALQVEQVERELAALRASSRGGHGPSRPAMPGAQVLSSLGIGGGRRQGDGAAASAAERGQSLDLLARAPLSGGASKRAPRRAAAGGAFSLRTWVLAAYLAVLHISLLLSMHLTQASHTQCSHTTASKLLPGHHLSA